MDHGLPVQELELLKTIDALYILTVCDAAADAAALLWYTELIVIPPLKLFQERKSELDKLLHPLRSYMEA